MGFTMGVRQILYFVVTITVFNYVQITSGLNLAGPYNCAEEVNVGNCKGTDFPIKVDWHMERIGQNTRVSSGHLIHPFDWDERVGLSTSISQWTTGGWKPIMSNYKPYSCKALKEMLPDIFDQWATALGAPLTCPWPKGKYNMRNMTTCLKARNFPMLPYGKFRIHANNTFNNGTQASCVFVDIVVEPAIPNIG